MVIRSKFLEDLADGKKAEEYIAKLYKEKYFTTGEYMSNATKAYDICFLFPRKKRVRLEIKYDKMAKKTGNLCFELFDDKSRPSGILATEADLTVYMLDKNTIFEFQTNELKKFIEYAIKEKQFKVVKGGDNRAFTMIIVPIDTITRSSFCKRIK